MSHWCAASGNAAAEAEAERHVAALCRNFGVPLPALGASEHRARLGSAELIWERHTEFSAYTVLAPAGDGVVDASPALDLLPPEWLAATPGEVLVALHLSIRAASLGASEDGLMLAEACGSDDYAGSRVAGGLASVWTTLRPLADGFSRIVVHDHGLDEREAGRLVQRLLEIETYRLFALLALPEALAMEPKLRPLQEEADSIARGFALLHGTDAKAEAVHRLSELAAGGQALASSVATRFAAAGAYAALIRERLSELREERILGLPTLGELVGRHFEPAMRTVETTSGRLSAFLECVGRAVGLLRVSVAVAQERQSNAILASLDRRARLQLRLQETVEGLSVVVISYYVLGLLGYLMGALGKAGMAPPLDGAFAPMLPVAVVVVVWLALRHLRARIARSALSEPAE